MRRKASITVEAAMVLPVFILFCIGLLSVIKIVYIQQQMGNAMSIALLKMNEYAITADSLGLTNQFTDYYQNTNNLSFDQQIEILSGIQQAQHIDTTAVSILEIGSNSLKMEENTSSLFKWPTTIDSLDDLRVEWEKVYGLIAEQFQSIFAMVETFIEIGKSFYESRGDSGKNIQSESIVIAITQVLNEVARSTIEKELSKDKGVIESLVNGTRGLDFSYSNYFVSENEMHLIIDYKIKLPVSIGTLDTITMRQKKMIRGFVGHSEVNVESYDEETEITQMVYMSVSQFNTFDIGSGDKNQKIYHLTTSCSSLNVNVNEVIYSEKLLDMPFCKVCSKGEKPEEWMGNSVYMTKTGKVVHTCETCPSIKRQWNEIPLEEAVNMGARPCKICGGMK